MQSRLKSNNTVVEDYEESNMQQQRVEDINPLAILFGKKGNGVKKYKKQQKQNKESPKRLNTEKENIEKFQIYESSMEINL